MLNDFRGAKLKLKFQPLFIFCPVWLGG